MEFENDITATTGGYYDFGARIHDPRLGRFLSLDPLMAEFPSESNYSFAGNNSIYFIDSDGEKKVTYITVIEKGEKTIIEVINEDYTVPKEIFYSVPKWPEGGQLKHINVEYNVVEFITIDVDKNEMHTTGEILTDPAWDDWAEIFPPIKASPRAGGNALVAPDMKIPANFEKYLPTAENPGNPIDISELMGGRGGASLTGKTGQIVEVMKTSFEAGQVLGDAINELADIANGKYCTTCQRAFSRSNREIKDDKTTPKDTITFREH